MAAYSPYDLLRTLIERVGWPVEEEKRVALESVNEWERMQIFGNLATMTACPHEEISYATGACVDCGSRLWAGNRTKKG